MMKDSNDRSLRMPDGIPMETHDERVIMMHNAELWQRLTQHRTLNPIEHYILFDTGL